ncbi:MAG: LysE family transporter [Candidatus Paceibacterota bacterium]|jgi:threonine/homoserine/homoserine lactone efflux protein
MSVFLTGIIVALAISVPMGAVAIFVIHRIIAKNWKSSIPIIVGSMLANIVFSLVASFGVSFLSVFISEEERGLGMLGALFLFFIGLNIMFSRSNFLTTKDEDEQRLIKREVKWVLKDLGVGFMLTITNPLTFLAILGFIAWLGGGGEVGSVMYMISIAGGIICGLFLWWVGVLIIVSLVKARMKIPSLQVINKVFGILLIVASVILLIRLF